MPDNNWLNYTSYFTKRSLEHSSTCSKRVYKMLSIWVACSVKNEGKNFKLITDYL